MWTILLIVKFFVVFSFLLVPFIIGLDAIDANHFNLISQIHNYFGTSCVFVVHSSYEGKYNAHHIENVQRQFSSRQILTVAVDFIRLKETMQLYSKRIVRALIVVSLQSHEIMNEFSNLTKNFNMAVPCWLLIFDDKVYLENYLPYSDENIFHLTFNTELLVTRTNHKIVQEWFWLKNRVKVEDFGVWDYDTKFILKNNQSLYQRRTDLENMPITVTLTNNPPMITYINNTIGGYFGILLKELSIQSNFKIEIILPQEMSYGSWISKEMRWTGMMDMLTTGKASIAVADFTITNSRLKAIDFSLPIIATTDKLYIKKPDGGIQWSAYLQTLTPEIWIIIQMLILFTTLFLTLTTTVRGSRVTLELCVSYFLLVLGIYCQQGLPEFPSDLPTRIVYFSIFLSALVVSAAYSAALISYLTVISVKLPFSSLEGFVEDGTYDLIVFRDGAEYDMFMVATEPTLVKMKSKLKYKAMLPVTLLDGFMQVCKGKVAFYVPAALAETIDTNLPCQVIGINTKRTVSLAMGLTKGNPYNGLINYHVQKFRDHGILSCLKEVYAPQHHSSAPVSSHSEVTVWGVIPVLAVLAGGILLAIFILFLERIYRAQRKQTSKSKEIRIVKKEKQKEIFKRGLRNQSTFLPSLNFHP